VRAGTAGRARILQGELEPELGPNNFGILAPVNPVRWMVRQHWRPAIAGPTVFYPPVNRPTTIARSPRRLPAGRAMLQSGTRPSPYLLWRLSPLTPVASPRRMKAGQATFTRTSIGPTPPQTAYRGLMVSSPRRPKPGRASFTPASVGGEQTAFRGLSISRPIPRRPGRVWMPAGLAPPIVVGGTPATPLRGLSITGGRYKQRGRVWQPVTLGATPPCTAFRNVAPIASPRRMKAGRAAFTRSSIGPTPPYTAFHGLSVVGGQPRRRGRLWMPAGLAPLPAGGTPGTPLHGLSIAGGRYRQRGRVWQPATLGPTPPETAFRGLVVRGGQPRRRGSVWTPCHLYAPPLSAVARFAGPLMVHRSGEDRARRRAGWALRWFPSPLFGPTIGYNIYSNAGGGPINYTTPIATTYELSWTSGPLAYPDTWMFGVRAFNGNGEEKNLDCAVEIVLDASGNDITMRPEAPFGLRAFATAGGGIRAEWTYPFLNSATLPTGFHVYLTPFVPGVLFPVSPLMVAGRRRRVAGATWRGSGGHVPVTPIGAGTGGDRAAGQRWRGALGTSLVYSTPAATVLYSSMIANTFVANLAGLSNGVTYLVGVRAYNAVAEEPNTSAVTVTAVSIGPLPVDSLVGIAV